MPGDCKCKWVANSGKGGEPDYRKMGRVFAMHVKCPYCGSRTFLTKPQWEDHWHERYMARMIQRAALTEAQAKEALDAGMDEFDYSDIPEDAADMEMSYWAE